MDKKVIFLNIYQGNVDRGAETFVYEISKRISKDFGVNILAGKRQPISRWPVLWRFFIDPQGISIFFWTFLRLPYLFKNKYDIVIPLNGGWQSGLVRIVTWLYGGKMVISGQSGIGWDDRNNIWNFPDRFVPISLTALSWAKKVNSRVRSVYIPNGVDLEKFSKKVKPLKIDLPHPIVLSVGALEKNKRLDLVVKAVQKTNFSLLLVGKGDLEKELNEMGKKMLGERFKIISLPFEDMPRVYPAADVFTYPTVPVESFGIVLVEAMASGLPVVATDDPIRREIVGEAGLFVDPIDTEKYTEMLKKSVEAKWDGKPRKQAEKFDWDLIAKRYEELFNELVK